MSKALKLMTAALMPAAVLTFNTALADDLYTVKITNNTEYEFIDGVYKNKSGVNVQTPIPVTIPAGESGTVQFEYNVNTSPHLNMHWTLENDDGHAVAAIIKDPGNCHTDVPDGIHSDHYNCNSKNIAFVYCMSDQTEDCNRQ
ncbi:hypothetical protein [Ruegeria sp.]|uniref:hypothetical protein n=1 Tax=Ruegeria sp. TaxID=1879320 RepID=UPI003C7AAAC2